MQPEGAILSEEQLPLTAFLESLMTEGRALVSSHPLVGDNQEVMPWLEQLEKVSRAELTGESPAFSGPVALWAARLLYQLCQLTVCRDKGEDHIVAVCTAPCPADHGPETDWSADLLFRHLPDLFQMARHVGSGDPLVQHLKQLAAQWPLSSVGIPDLKETNVDAFVTDPVLLRLYADRILETADHTRLGQPYLDDILRGDLRVHPELAPGLARCLFPDSDQGSADAEETTSRR